MPEPLSLYPKLLGAWTGLAPDGEARVLFVELRTEGGRSLRFSMTPSVTCELAETLVKAMMGAPDALGTKTYQLPERATEKVEVLANTVREMATGMRAADVMQALASVIVHVACETSSNRATAHAIIASLSEEMIEAVSERQRPDWAPGRPQ